MLTSTIRRNTLIYISCVAGIICNSALCPPQSQAQSPAQPRPAFTKSPAQSEPPPALQAGGSAKRYARVYRDDVRCHWTPDGQWMWYSVNAKRGNEYFKVNLQTGEKSPMLQREPLVIALQELLDDHFDSDAHLERLWRDIRVLELTPDLSILFRCRGQTYEWFLSRRADSGDNSQANLQVVKANEDDDSQYFTLERRSRSGGTEVELTLTNSTPNAIECMWLSTSGDAVRYQTIQPHASLSQHTFENHIWSLRKKSGEELIRIRTPDYAYSIEITPKVVSDFESYREQPRPRRRNRARPNRPNDRETSRVVTKDNNLWLRNEDGKLEKLTDDGTPEHRFRSPMVSPSGHYVAAIEEQVATKRIVHLVDSSPGDQLQPKLIEVPYVKPGDEIDRPRIYLRDLENQRDTPVSNDLFKTPWNLSRFRWLEDPERLIFLYNERGHQTLRVLSLDPASGEVQCLIEEASDSFIDYSQKTYLQVVNEGKELLWTSERSGFNHLYRFRSTDGNLLNAVTEGQWVVRDIVHVDESNQTVWFSASGIFDDQDPYYKHLCRTNFDGTQFHVLTAGDGDHRWEFSPNRKFIVDRYSRVDMPTQTALRSAETGAEICKLESADWSDLIEGGWSIPERFHTAGRDGETEIYGIIIRPDDFDPSLQYPVVEKIYAGPHSSHVPKAFSKLRQEHEIANEGFIVVRIDGMGTSNRGKKFHDVCWKNLADAGFPDRKIWIRAAAAKYPEMDLERVGIFGGSAGGQNAMRALLDHNDLYDVAVADCGCHDNRMDKIWWNEAWMGWPVDESYAASSNVEHADRLEGKLLLIVGELDRNVDPASTMQVANALIKADKDFDLLILPGTGHGAAETPYGKRKRVEFLKRHLLDLHDAGD